jgi:hypothetical protein
LKNQIHKAEVDLNYTQFFPLAEVYVSLYTSKTAPGEGPKPPMWTEVERSMEDGTLSRLRNRPPARRVSVLKAVQSKLANVKPQSPAVDTSGLNRRERRKLLGVQGFAKSKNKSLPSNRSQAPGAQEGGKSIIALNVEDDGSESDGGFFEP